MTRLLSDGQPQAPTHSYVPGSLNARITSRATTLAATNTTGQISSLGFTATVLNEVDA